MIVNRLAVFIFIVIITTTTTITILVLFLQQQSISSPSYICPVDTSKITRLRSLIPDTTLTSKHFCLMNGWTTSGSELRFLEIFYYLANKRNEKLLLCFKSRTFGDFSHYSKPEFLDCHNQCKEHEKHFFSFGTNYLNQTNNNYRFYNGEINITTTEHMGYFMHVYLGMKISNIINNQVCLMHRAGDKITGKTKEMDPIGFHSYLELIHSFQVSQHDVMPTFFVISDSQSFLDNLTTQTHTSSDDRKVEYLEHARAKDGYSEEWERSVGVEEYENINRIVFKEWEICASSRFIFCPFKSNTCKRIISLNKLYSDQSVIVNLNCHKCVDKFVPPVYIPSC